MAVISSETLHATTVAIDGRAVVLEGPSGSGKSDLALRLIDRGAVLISDDVTWLVRVGAGLVARVPGTVPPDLIGRMEVRGIGIVALAHVAEAPLGMIVRLTGEPLRLPDRRARRIAGVAVREVTVEPFRTSAPIKVELALRQPEAMPA